MHPAPQGHGIQDFWVYRICLASRSTLDCMLQIVMDCFASLMPCWIKQCLGSIRSDIQKEQVIFFADAERGPNNLMITFLRDRFYDRFTWTEFKSLGPPAMAAVVRAGWRCVALDQIAESIRAGRFDEKELGKLLNEARERRKRVSIRKPSDPVSVFEID
ncbi:hypothetical protein BO94DRAFT_394158 [Aspergillus sclerotioniger CBS 115572]|uniref:Uncharacterized protein n=1 Tax=Aspergillus sclerotioniger CBS 115572 TaxID=1450535 RepID=A0A317WYI5_9EURO|nr:hypothetical protein BO94DRAFT_394158 [Aspergillus sclerotioniger CBS 115572]PWY91466.1 hypothetical protein BO94DRAFT_394158 [Aspergillus sclerotioniger CBS 115572]